MTEQEFDTAIDEVAKDVVENPNNGLCVTIYRKIGWNAAELFEQYFYPFGEIAIKVKTILVVSPFMKTTHWLSDDHIVNHDDGMNQIERRLMFLYSFKNFCKTDDHYEKIGTKFCFRCNSDYNSEEHKQCTKLVAQPWGDHL